jgi:hypothetical protein
VIVVAAERFLHITHYSGWHYATTDNRGDKWGFEWQIDGNSGNGVDTLPCVVDTVHFLPSGKLKIMGCIYS